MLRDYVQLGTTSLSEYQPNLVASTSQHAHTIALIPENTPGVLAHVNQVLAEHDVNIGGHVLATRHHTGYVVTDTGSPLSARVVADLRAVPETVRVRVID